MLRLALLLLLLAAPAWGQTTLFLDENTGDIDCEGTDDELVTSFGGGGTNHVLAGPDESDADRNWTNADDVRSNDWSGFWGCNLFFDVTSGGGAPNRVTIQVEQVVISSCGTNELIFEEETPALTKGAVTEYNCTGVTKRVDFSVNLGIKLLMWQSNGGNIVQIKYNASSFDSSITVPPVVSAGGITNDMTIIGRNQWDSEQRYSPQPFLSWLSSLARSPSGWRFQKLAR